MKNMTAESYVNDLVPAAEVSWRAGAYRVDKEVPLLDELCVEEKYCAGLRLGQEVGGCSCDPVENLEACTRFQHEHSDDLLTEEADDDRGPAALFSTTVSQLHKGGLTMVLPTGAQMRARSRTGTRTGRARRWHGHRNWCPL